MGSPINFARVDARVFRGGAPDREGWAWLYGKGVRASINLEWEASDATRMGGIPIVEERVKDFEPLPWFAPSLADGHVGRALLAIQVSSPVIYVHCKSGLNRTGVVIAAYRLLILRESMASVIADFRSFRGFWAWGDERYIRGIPNRSSGPLLHWL